MPIRLMTNRNSSVLINFPEITIMNDTDTFDTITYEEKIAEEAAEAQSIADSNARFEQALSDLQDETERCIAAGETPPTYRDTYRLVDADGVVLKE